MADYGEGTWAIAGRDFTYDDKAGAVKRGQYLQLGGHINDGQLLEFAFVAVADPQPTKSELSKKPTCGVCGGVFVDEVHRDMCGRAHELSPRDAELDRRYKAHETVEASTG